MVVIPATISVNASCCDTEQRYQRTNLTFGAPIEFWTQISGATSRCGTSERETTPLAPPIISRFLAVFAIFVACISAVIVCELRVLQLKIDKLQMKTARRIWSEKKRSKKRSGLGSDCYESTRVMENDESTMMMESIAFSPSLPETLSPKSLPDSH